MSRFPKLTETFVLDEILALEARGVRVEIFPLWREREEVVHPAARAATERAHFLPTLDLGILRDNLAALRTAPGVWAATLRTLIWSNRGSLRYLAAALAVFPKAVSFARRMQTIGVHHVHAHFASHPAAAAFVVGRIAGLPWSFTAHGSDLHREQAMLAEKVAEADFVVTISDYNRRFILERVGARWADRIRVIHCGVGSEFLDPADEGTGVGHRHRLPEPGGTASPSASPSVASEAAGTPEAPAAPATSGTAEAALELVCIGTLHEVKGQTFLLEAGAGLTRRGVDWRLHLVGDGPDRATLVRRAEALGVGERVRFHGALDRAGVRAVLSRAHVAIAPSVPTRDGRREGIPVVLMEAAALGLPLVASRLSGIPELVRHEQTGLLVTPGDASEIEAALARMADEPDLRRRLGRAARSLVEREFRLEENVARLSRAFFPSAERVSQPCSEPSAERSSEPSAEQLSEASAEQPAERSSEREPAA